MRTADEIQNDIDTTRVAARAMADVQCEPEGKGMFLNNCAARLLVLEKELSETERNGVSQKANASFETPHSRGNIDCIADGTTMCEIAWINDAFQRCVTLSGLRAGSIITWDQEIPRWALSTVHTLTRLIGIVPCADSTVAGDNRQTRADSVAP